MIATVNAAAVKAALTVTGRIAGTDVPVFAAFGSSLLITRHGRGTAAPFGRPHARVRTTDARRNGVDGTAATARVPATGQAFGGGVIPADVLARLGKVRGDVEVTTDGDGGLRFASGGVNLGGTVPDADANGPDLQRVAWPHTALTSGYAVKVEADYGHHGPEVARAAVDALQGVAEAAAKGSDARAVLTAVALHADGTAAATDTYRLHVATLPVEVGPEARPDAEVLIPGYVLQAIPAGKVVGFRLAGAPPIPAEALAAGVWGMTARLQYGTAANRVTVAVDAHGPTVEGPYPGWRTIVANAEALPPAGTYVLPDGMPEAVKAVQAKGPTYVAWQDGADAVTLQAMTNAPGGVIGMPEGGASAAIGTATTGSAAVILQAAYFAPAAGFVGAGGTVQVADGLRAVSLVGTGGRRALVMPMRGGSA